MRNKRTTMTLAAASAAVLAACGGGGSGGLGGGIAGIGGTGTGGVSGFASIIINDDKELNTDGVAADNYTLDGDPISRTTFEDNAKYRGMVVRYKVSDDTENNGLTTATATTIEAFNQVKGPVTGISPLEVLGQEVVCTGDTFLDNLASCGALTVGQFAEVAGFTSVSTNFPTVSDVIQATRVERKAASPLVWKIRGIARSVTASQFTIGNQVIQIGGVTPRDCVGGLVPGDLVEVKASQDPGFTPGSALDTVTDIECETDALDTNNPVSTVIDASIEGFVKDMDAATKSFAIGDQEVVFTNSTVFLGGAFDALDSERNDLVDGVRVEVEGEVDDGGGLNTSTGVLTASKIEFRQSRVRIIAPISPGDVVDGISLSILGITVLGMPNTEDEVDDGDGGGILENDVNIATQVQVRGFADGSGLVYAEELRDEGSVDFDDVRLRGPISNIVPGVSFEILGVLVEADTTNDFRDRTGAAIDINTFFSSVSAGTVVDVNKASLIGGDLTDGPNGMEITIED